jgi:hypothetical protein
LSSSGVVATTTGSSTFCTAGSEAITTISSALVIKSNLEESIFKSLTLITSLNSFNELKSTSILSTKSLLRHLTSISFICSSKIAHNFLASLSHTKFKGICVCNFSHSVIA